VRRLALLALLLAGCGGGAGDLLLVERTGDLPGAELSLRFTVDGRVACNRGPLRPLPSDKTIEVRAIHRDLTGSEDVPGPAARDLVLPPGPAALLRYDVRLEAGRVRFSDSGAPPLLGRLVRLTRKTAMEVCGLAR
jgi:hypothetical protein